MADTSFVISKFLKGFIPVNAQVGKILWVILISLFVVLSIRWVDNRSKKGEFEGAQIGTVVHESKKQDMFFFGCSAKRGYIGIGIR